jgi:hypothetical protein
MKEMKLMVGDYIFFEDEKLCMTTIGVVEELIKEFGSYTIKGIDQWGNEFEERLIDIEPIPLTEEILVNNCSFEKPKKKENTFYFEDYFKLVLEDDNWNDISFDVFVGGKYLTVVGGLHELQQLYRIIMKKNLDIKLLV